MKEDCFTLLPYISSYKYITHLGNITPNRRQSTGDGLFSFKIPVLPVLRDLGIVPPRGKMTMMPEFLILFCNSRGGKMQRVDQI